MNSDYVISMSSRIQLTLLVLNFKYLLVCHEGFFLYIFYLHNLGVHQLLNPNLGGRVIYPTPSWFFP